MLAGKFGMSCGTELSCKGRRAQGLKAVRAEGSEDVRAQGPKGLRAEGLKTNSGALDPLE